MLAYDRMPLSSPVKVIRERKKEKTKLKGGGKLIKKVKEQKKDKQKQS